MKRLSAPRTPSSPGGRAGPRPPAFCRWLLVRLLPADDAEFVAGDLDEEFRRYATSASGSRRGRLRAGLWYRSQALRSWWHVRRARRGLVWLATEPAGQHLNPVGRPPGGGRSFFLRSPGDPLMSSFVQDARLSIRNLLRAPGFTLLVILTLGVGVGATTSMFSAVNEVLLRPLSFVEPDKLVMLWDNNRERGWEQVEVSPANALDWRDRVAAFDDVALVATWTIGAALETAGETVEVQVGTVSGNLFSVLGVPPLHGRGFRFEETWTEAGPLVVLGHEAWVRYFDGDPSIVGETAMLDGTAYQVIGIMGPAFDFAVNEAEMWVTFQWAPAIRQGVWFRQAHVAHGIARLAPGVTPEEARAELDAVGARLRDEYPELNRGMEPGFSGLQEYLVGDQSRTLLLLLGAVGLLQLIACANVANLLLVRATARRHEMAVRTALGARGSSIARLVLTEAGLLAAAGTVVGIGIAAAAMRWIEAIRPPELPELVFRLDPRLLAFTATVAIASALIFSLLPIVRTARLRRIDQRAVACRTGTATAPAMRAAGSLVSLEVALAVILVVGAGLMVRSIARLGSVESGIDADGVFTFQLTPPSGLYPQDRDREDLAYRLVERLEGLPGVTRAGATRGLPFAGYGWTSDFAIEGSEPDDFGIEVRHRAVTSGYFETMRVPLVEGDIFDDLRTPDEAVPVVVNQAFVDAHFPDESPVGRRIAFDRNPTERSYWYPIVGVVGNERMVHATAPQPEIISHFAGDTPGTMRFVLRTEVPPESIGATVRETVADVDPRIPFVAPRTMDEVAADALIRERFLMTLLAAFGSAALTLAAVGVYGVAAQSARGRTREIGIRMALGATGEDIVRRLVFRAAAFVAVGLLVGLGAAAASGRVMTGFLFGVEPVDPATWLAVAALLGLVGLVASYLPARSAVRADPVKALYSE